MAWERAATLEELVKDCTKEVHRTLVRLLHEKRTSLAAPVSSASQKAPQYEEAWQVLMTPGKVKDQVALTQLMEEHGIDKASDLENLIDAGELSVLATMAATLKTAGALSFKKCMCIT